MRFDIVMAPEAVEDFDGLKANIRAAVYDSIEEHLRHEPTKVRMMKEVALSEVKDDLSKYLRLSENEVIVITRHGKPAGVLVGFASEDDWFDYKLENDPRFLQRVAQARKSLQAGKGVKLEELKVGQSPRRRRTKRRT